MRVRSSLQKRQHADEQRARRAANIERVREIARRSYHKHREKNLERARLYREAHRDEINARKRAKGEDPAVRWRRRIRSYGLTAEDYEGMLAAQRGLCAICERPERPGRDGKLVRLSVDHDHETGKVRGLLCRTCNTALGVFENRHLAARLSEYLEANG